MGNYKIPDDLPSNLLVYAKMLKVGLGKQSVLNKMRMDNVSEEMFDQYLDPDRQPAEKPPEEEDEFASDEEENNPLYAGGENTESAAPPAPASNQTNLLALEPAKVDMSGMNPMPIKKTLIMVNAFISETITFLNGFVTNCEKRLEDVDGQIHQMKLRMIMLENKLNSIEWLRNGDDLKEKPVAQPAEQNQSTNESRADPETEGEAISGDEQGAAAEPAQNSLKDDERYRLYFKMLSVRVPPPAVGNKMRADGISEDIIEQVLSSV